MLYIDIHLIRNRLILSENTASFHMVVTSKTGLKRPLKQKTKNWLSLPIITLMQVKSIAECSKRAFCNTFDPQ